MDFLQETGAIISSNGISMSYFDGSTGHVDFDIELIIKLHKISPGCIWKFAHTHPFRMSSASEIDRMMIRTLVPALYPFPVRLSIITSLSRDYQDWVETTYLGTMESKEEWKKSDRKFREIRIVEESIKNVWVSQKESETWQNYLLERSYKI